MRAKWAGNALLGIVCAGIPAFGTVATAQDALNTTETVVVTGTRIIAPNQTSVSPLLELKSTEIKLAGTLRLEDTINQLPQVFVDQSITANNSATGTATVNLRGLGPERTLVLIDGKRMMPGDPTSGSVAPDLNLIPQPLVDHIDIVTGGASAVYGSDAVAGVVNFVMKRDFIGLQLDAEGGIYNHSNDELAIHSALALRGLPQAPSSLTDGANGGVTLTAGIDAPDGKGNLTVYGGYLATSPITEDSRDFSACALTAKGFDFSCAESYGSTYPGHFFVLDPATFKLVGNYALDSNGSGDTLQHFDQSRDGFNYAPYAHFQRDDARYTAGAFAHYTFSSVAEIYVDGMFMQDNTSAQLAPSGLFADSLYAISCLNPMLSADEGQKFCTDAHVPPGGNALIAIGRRDIEAGARQGTFNHVDYRIVWGVRGDLDDWHYDISAQHGAVSVEDGVLHDISLARVADALNVVRDPAGNLVCASGNSGCVPFDIFKAGGVTKAALAYIDAPARSSAGTGETVVSANIAGDLDGIRSAWSASDLSVAAGAEYRRESLDYSPDAELASGDLSGSGAASPPVSGAFDVKEIYGEARLPLVQNNRSLLYDITLDGGYRYSWYSNAGEAATYKAGAEWSPDQSLTFRSSFNHAVRAPNVDDLFTPQLQSQDDLSTDPCAGANPLGADPFATAANCARTGVSATQYRHIALAPNGYNTLDGGNPKLRPETTDTETLGMVLAPPTDGKFSLSVDYFHIKILGVIQQIDPAFTLEQCLQTGAPAFCNLVHRAPGTGSLWLTPQGYVTNIFENAASLSTEGADFDFNFSHALPIREGRDPGSVDIRLIGTWLMGLTNLTAIGARPYDCAGYYGYGNTEGCGDPAPRWRHMLRTTWNAPWGFNVSVAWRYVDATQVAAASSNPDLSHSYAPADFQLGSRSYIDLSVDWQVSKKFELRMGVNNLFDRDPPFAGTSSSDFLYGVAANGNTYPGVYDALGRWLFIGVTARD